MSTYGSGTHTIDELQSHVSTVLGLEFVLHESSFRCGNYWLAEHDWNEQAIIQQNCVDEHGDLAEPDFPDHRVLLYVEADLDETPLRAIEGLELLREE